MKKFKRRDDKGIEGLFIPAGIFIGMGIGFLVDNLPGGMFIGMGCGFAAFAISVMVKKK